MAEEILACIDTDPYALPEERLAPFAQALGALRGDPQLADAIEELARLAGYFGELGAATVADSLLTLIAGQAANLQSLRLRLCGQDDAEAEAAQKLHRFAQSPLALVAPTHRPHRDFRIALLANRGETK